MRPGAAWLCLVTISCGRHGFERADSTSAPHANVVFVTSSVHTGNLGGLDGADRICASRATEAGHPGTFVAWLSTASVPAASRFEGSRGWVLVDGTPLVLDRPPPDGTIRNPITLDERGREVRPTQPIVWTGTRADGRSAPMTCAGWTSSGVVETGVQGDVRGGPGAATEATSSDCSKPRRVICGEVGQLEPVQITPASGRFAFVTVRPFVPSVAGIAAADALCGEEATAAGLPGTYLALLPLTGSAAASRFDLTGAPWIRVDGTRLAATATGMMADQFLSSFLDTTASGAIVDAPQFWGGEPRSAAAASCADWTVTTGGARFGTGTWTDHGRLFDEGDTGCNNAGLRLMCLQQ